MPSKTSKKPVRRKSSSPSGGLQNPKKTTLELWKAEPSCSEIALEQLARDFAAELTPSHRVLLEGPLGAGKTTFARFLLKALGVNQPPEGSPTFAIAHEYQSARGEVVHIDLFRVESEEELDLAGIPAYFWERELIALSEWTSRFPKFAEALARDGNAWKVTLSFAESPERRAIRIERYA